MDDANESVPTGSEKEKIDKAGRVKMGKSTCDDGVHNIEQDLKNMDRDTTCDKKVCLNVLNDKI